MVKCSEVLQYSDGLSNKVSNIIRRYVECLYVFYYYNILSYSLDSIFINAYIVVFLFNNLIYVFLLYVYVSSSCQLTLFGYPD